MKRDRRATGITRGIDRLHRKVEQTRALTGHALGEEPDDFLYLADSEGRVYENMFHEKHHDACAAFSRQIGIVTSLFLFCLTSAHQKIFRAINIS